MQLYKHINKQRDKEMQERTHLYLQQLDEEFEFGNDDRSIEDRFLYQDQLKDQSIQNLNRNLQMLQLEHELIFEKHILSQKSRYRPRTLIREIDDEQQIIQIPIALLGNQKVGKTAIMMKYLDSKQSTETTDTTQTHVTNPINIRQKLIRVNNRQIMLKIIQNSIPRQFQTYLYGSKVKAIIFVYDITNRHSFQNIRVWHNILKNTIQRDSNIIIMLLGNRCDLTEQRQVEMMEAILMAQELGINFCFEVSGLQKINIDECFKPFLGKIIQQEDIIQSQMLPKRIRLKLIQQKYTSCC